ncbi:hypothetical protein MKEN_00971800 [Mycena kentingensis (nom. inval.)]|nr:hypothetical protein MKEN_00971800 [Mycena kentingensis (nom. inval.)]
MHISALASPGTLSTTWLGDSLVPIEQSAPYALLRPHPSIGSLDVCPAESVSIRFWASRQGVRLLALATPTPLTIVPTLSGMAKRTRYCCTDLVRFCAGGGGRGTCTTRLQNARSCTLPARTPKNACSCTLSAQAQHRPSLFRDAESAGHLVSLELGAESSKGWLSSRLCDRFHQPARASGTVFSGVLNTFRFCGFVLALHTGPFFGIRLFDKSAGSVLFPTLNLHPLYASGTHLRHVYDLLRLFSRTIMPYVSHYGGYGYGHQYPRYHSRRHSRHHHGYGGYGYGGYGYGMPMQHYYPTAATGSYFGGGFNPMVGATGPVVVMQSSRHHRRYY